MAVAEVSDDRVLVAGPDDEKKLVLDPVAWLESVVHAVFAKLWSAILTEEDSWKNVPVFWYAQSTIDTSRPTMTGRVRKQER